MRKNTIYLKELLDVLKKNNINIDVHGLNFEYSFSDIKQTSLVTSESLDWTLSSEYEAHRINNSKAKILICSRDVDVKAIDLASKCIIKVPDPKATIICVLSAFFLEPEKAGIHSTAFIHPNAIIGEGCFIGPFTYIGDSKIGKNTKIYGNCYIYDNVIIGENVIIHAGVVIGADGFGYLRDAKGSFYKFPHIAGVEINNNVEIGANSCIDRGTLGNTRIGNGVKIDNLVQIAHNVEIGNDTAILGNSSIAGSTVIGEKCWIAPHTIIKEHLTIGNNVFVGMASAVNSDIKDNQIWLGNPAVPIKEYRMQLKTRKATNL